MLQFAETSEFSLGPALTPSVRYTFISWIHLRSLRPTELIAFAWPETSDLDASFVPRSTPLCPDTKINHGPSRRVARNHTR